MTKIFMNICRTWFLILDDLGQKLAIETIDDANDNEDEGINTAF